MSLHAINVCSRSTHTHTNKKIANAASSRTLAALSHTRQIHQAAQKFHRNKGRQEVTAASEADAVLQYHSTTVSVSLYLCLHLIPPEKKKKKVRGGGEGRGEGGSCVSAQPKKRDYPSHNNTDASQKPCQLSDWSCVSDVGFFFPPHRFFNLSLP